MGIRDLNQGWDRDGIGMGSGWDRDGIHETFGIRKIPWESMGE